ncbi:MAG: diguanylate cyclase [Pseudomonadota bacterium]|nr:diguanylate cyclase [Pseudomonadota bacterium]
MSPHRSVSNPPTASSDVANQPLSPQLLTYAQDMLEQQRLTLHFAHSALESAYVQRRAMEYREIVRLGWPLLLIVYVMLLGMSIQFYPQDMFFKEGILLRTLWLPAFVVMMIGVFAPLRLAFAARFEWFVSICGTVLLTLLLLCYFFAQTADFADHAMLNISVTLLIMAFASRIRVWWFGLILLVASGVSLGVALSIGLSVHWLKLGHFLLLHSCVMIFVMAMMEANHRLAFLQSLLLVEQNRQLVLQRQHIESSAREDVLSGLPNRRAFDEIFRREWERTRRDQQDVSLLYIDIDYFKLYNDNYGQDAGDTVLRQIAQVLQQALLRPADQATRYNGESFILILPNTHTQGAIRVASRLIEAVDHLAIEHRWSQVASHLTVSIGIATSQPDESDSLQVLIRADDALYQANRAGRHRYFVNG